MTDQSRGVRALEASAGLLSAGVLVTGVLLAILKWLAPAFLSGSGLSATDGPRWDRILAPLIIGVAGELSRRLRRGHGTRVRLATAAITVLLCLAALWWGWWS